MLCKCCGKPITGKRCLCCGTAVGYRNDADSASYVPYVFSPPSFSERTKKTKRTNGFAIASLVFTILIYTCVFGLLFGILGLKKSKRINGKGKVISIVCIVISALSTAVWACSLTFMLLD